jgi:hypothetical protein
MGPQDSSINSVEALTASLSVNLFCTKNKVEKKKTISVLSRKNCNFSVFSL